MPGLLLTTPDAGPPPDETLQSVSLIDSDVKYVILLTSLSFNVCVLIWAGSLWVQRQRSLHRRPTRLAVYSDGGKTETRIAESFADVILSILCGTCGLYVLTSRITPHSPFVSTPSSVPKYADDTEHDSRLSGPMACVVLALGRFIFTILHLAYRGTTDGLGLTSVLKYRLLYLTVTVACLVVVIIYGEDVILAGCILLAEADSIVEGIYQVINTSTFSTDNLIDSAVTIHATSFSAERPLESDGRKVNLAASTTNVSTKQRTLSVLICVIGCVVCLGLRFAFIAIVVSAVQTFNPMAMNVVSLGCFSFAIMFYVVYSAIIVERLTNRLRKITMSPSNTSSVVRKYISCKSNSENLLKRPGLRSYILASRLAMDLVHDKMMGRRGRVEVGLRKECLRPGYEKILESDCLSTLENNQVIKPGVVSDESQRLASDVSLVTAV